MKDLLKCAAGLPSIIRLCRLLAKEAFIFEVSDSSYGKYVLLNSHRVPVVVAFIGVWSEHCMAVTDPFAGLARELIVTVIIMLAPNNPAFAQQYRRKLSSMLSR